MGNNDKKIVIAVFAGAVVFSLLSSIMLFSFISSDKKKDGNEEVYTSAVEEKYTTSEVKAILDKQNVDYDRASEKERNVLVLGRCESDFDDQRKRMLSNNHDAIECPQTEMDTIYNGIKEAFLKRDFLTVDKIMTDALNEYNFTSTESIKVPELYSDIVTLSKYYNLPIDNRSNMLLHSESLMGFIINAIYMEPSDKLNFFIDGQSVCPYLSDDDFITSVDVIKVDAEDEYIKHEQEVHREIFINNRAVYDCTITLDNGVKLTAYVAESCNGEYKIMTMREVTETNSYLTANDWK